MNAKGLHHIGITAPNREELSQWFVDIMGMTIMDSDEFHTFVDTGTGQFITIFDGDDIGLHHLSFSSSDVEATITALEKKGVEVDRDFLNQFQAPGGLPLQVSPESTIKKKQK